MLKKVVVTLVALSLAASLCACGGSPATTPVAENPTATPSAAATAEPTPEGTGGAAQNPAANAEDAIRYLEQIKPDAFGFPEGIDQYEVLYIEDTFVDGIDCHTMELHASYPGGGVETMNVYISTDLKLLYEYDDEAGSYREIALYNPEGTLRFPKSGGSQQGGAQQSGQQGGVQQESEPPQSDSNIIQPYPEGDEQGAIDLLFRYSARELNLPAELSEYVVRVDGELDFEGMRCFDVGVYADLGSRMELMNTYYVANDNSVVFAFDAQSGNFIALPTR